MKTAGLVLDFYDDRTGAILKSVCPTPETLPEAVKTAHILSQQERQVLRDEAYALILHGDSGQLRKFACVDEGNTILSTIYFRETATRLPAEAIKVAAQNLIAFNEEFGLPVPTDLKLAAETGMPAYEKRAAKMEGKASSGMARKRDSMQSPMVGDEADWAQRTNLLSVRGGADSGRVIPTANQMKTAHAQNLVDVSNSHPRLSTKAKVAKITALGGEYSLDSYSDVQQAVNFFNESWTLLSPKDRHEFAVKTAARADELGIPVTEIVDRYGSTEYGPDVEAHLANRRSMAPGAKIVWDELQEKRASIPPETFAEILAEADEQFGLKHEWGGAVFDPYYATFGGRGNEKTAAPYYEDPETGARVTHEQISSIPSDLVAEAFTPDFVEAFKADPVTIFESMPADTKAVLARMV